ncbi:MAG: pitrilysin family protein [Acidobacteriota bacterium]
MKKALCLATVVGLLAGAAAFGQVQKPSDLRFPPLSYDPPNPSDFRVDLGHGLRGYIQEDHSLPLVEVSALVNFGSLYVPRDKTGLDGILSDTLIKGGTATREGSAIEERIDFLGGNLRFFVGERTSTLTLSVLSKDLDEGLDLFFDVLMHPAFRQEPLDLAKARLIEQLRQANDQPGTVLRREFERLLYGDHPLTWQPTRATYQSVTAEDLRKMHDDYFVPGNVILAAAGDFSKPDLEAKVRKQTADWPEGHPEFPSCSKDFPEPAPGVYFIQKRINQGYISLGHLGIEDSNPDYFAVQIMNFILGGGSFTSRITTKVRSNEGLSYSQGSRFSYRWGFPGTFSGYVQTKSSTVGYAISLILDEIDRIRREPVSDAEMETAVNYYLESFANAFESPQDTMANFAELEMTGKPMDYYQTFRDNVRRVTKARVQEVANKYIHPDQLVITIVGDFEPCNQGGDQWPGPLDKLGKVRQVELKDPVTGE